MITLVLYQGVSGGIDVRPVAALELPSPTRQVLKFGEGRIAILVEDDSVRLFLGQSDLEKLRSVDVSWNHNRHPDQFTTAAQLRANGVWEIVYGLPLGETSLEVISIMTPDENSILSLWISREPICVANDERDLQQYFEV